MQFQRRGVTSMQAVMQVIIKPVSSSDDLIKARIQLINED